MMGDIKMTDRQNNHARTAGLTAICAALALALALAGCGGEATAEVEAERTVSEITIDGTDIFPESLTADAKGNIYAGSAGGTIYRAEPGATIATAWAVPDQENGLQSLFGVLADDAHGLLWTCSNQDMFSPGENALPPAIKAFTLGTGKIAASYDFPEGKPVVCNDIAIAADGTAFATETASGRIFQVAAGADEMTLFADGEELIGVDGIAFAEDGTMYINNVRQNLIQRVERNEDGSYAGLTTLELSEPVAGPDALRPLGGNRFLQAEGTNGRITVVTIEGDKANISVVEDRFDSTAAATHFGNTGYTAEGKIAYRFDPALQGQDPGPFTIETFPMPQAE
ncbi:sugar lactone lactonase YvrE [Altererythrobacter atlanticus]|uniref:Virginiamycin B lyase n=2 Tax=Croceibacterium atlanticum TaxID=1267766 RepID=A0A0F7KZ78_9SPHN|nr:hypothetical protein [Croceibacterium atlanticum]AKH44140.1 Virginiamycin B lyase [Croceibacterium atlanticum]MBB5732450.1 sugar lactone lactonase YvrE [Croceibacterium atlanticum]